MIEEMNRKRKYVILVGDGMADYPLESQPAFDGLIAASGRLYMATTGGKVICFGSP